MLATHTAALLGGSQGDGPPRQTPRTTTAPGLLGWWRPKNWTVLLIRLEGAFDTPLSQAVLNRPPTFLNSSQQL